MEYTIERFGKYTHTIKAGLSVVFPFIDRVGYKVNIRERKFSVQFADIKTKDNQEIYCSADIYLSVTNSYTAAYGAQNMDQEIRLKIEIEMKKLLKSMTMSEVLASADVVDKALLSEVNANEEQWGMQIRFIDVHKIHLMP